MQDGQEVTWWVALLLQLWDLPPDSLLGFKRTSWSDAASTALAQMTALYRSMQTLAALLIEQNVELQLPGTLASVAALIQDTQESCSR